MSEPHRLAGLDGLRGLAALAVFGVHFNQVVGLDPEYGPLDIHRLLANGEHGVSLFFSLSGLLLSLPFWKAMLRGGSFPSLGIYTARRALRILPAYYVCLIALLLLGGLWRVPGASMDIVLHAIFLFNYAEFSIFSINAPFWTLAVEMQFYLLLPLLFLAIWRLPPVVGLVMILGMGALAYAAHYLLLDAVTRIIEWPLDPALIWIRPYGAVLSHSLPGHLPHFLFGVLGGRLLVHLMAKPEATLARFRPFAETGFWLSALLVFILLGSEAGDRVQVPYGRYGLPLIPLLLTVLTVTVPVSGYARAWLDSAPLRGLGLISYGVYIYHLPCLHWLDGAMRGRGLDAAEHGLLFGGAGLLLTLVVALLSYRLVERPLLGIAHRRR